MQGNFELFSCALILLVILQKIPMFKTFSSFRFAVNIGTGDPDSRTAEVAVHFNVRVPQCYVVRNTRHHEKWGPEETTAFK